MLRARQSKRRHPQHRKPDASEMLDETPEEAEERVEEVEKVMEAATMADVFGDPLDFGPQPDPSDPDAE